MAEPEVQLLQDLKTRAILLWLPQSLSSQESTRKAGDAQKWVPSLGREDPPGEGNANPLQYSCLGNSWTEDPGGLQSMGL